MKPALLFIALLLFVNTSCTKHTSTAATPFLTGKWRLVLITGGIANVHLTAAQWGHTKSYIFGEKAKCTVTMDNVTTNTTYTTLLDTSYTSNTLANFVTIGTGASYEYSFSDNKLVLSQDVRVDGMVEWYEKEW